MKHAVSVSLGSSTRDKRVELELGGEKMIVERIGTDGDIEKYKKLFGELDGKVDAFVGHTPAVHPAHHGKGFLVDFLIFAIP